MMASRIVPTTFSNQPTGKRSAPVKDARHLAWLHELPCLVTQRFGVEAAHISYPDPRYGKLGRGKGQKESDRWAVPLIQQEHMRQHKIGERAYWDDVGIDPCAVAMALYLVSGDTELGIMIIRNTIRRPSKTWAPSKGYQND